MRINNVGSDLSKLLRKTCFSNEWYRWTETYGFNEKKNLHFICWKKASSVLTDVSPL